MFIPPASLPNRIAAWPVSSHFVPQASWWWSPGPTLPAPSRCTTWPRRWRGQSSARSRTSFKMNLSMHTVVDWSFCLAAVVINNATLKSVWPNLANFRHFGKILRVFGKFIDGIFPIWQMLSLLWQIGYIIGLIFIVAYGKIVYNNINIWSHWSIKLFNLLKKVTWLTISNQSALFYLSIVYDFGFSAKGRHKFLWFQSLPITQVLCTIWGETSQKQCDQMFELTVAQNLGTVQSYIFQHSPKSCQIFGLLLSENMSLRTFKNRPIWSHWVSQKWHLWVRTTHLITLGHILNFFKKWTSLMSSSRTRRSDKSTTLRAINSRLSLNTSNTFL